MKHFLLAAGLSIGNIIYQTATSVDYETAIERSFFQAVAIFICWFWES